MGRRPFGRSGDGGPRVAKPQRTQQELLPTSLDEAVPADHPVRGIWELVERLDLSAFYDRIRVRGEMPGRPAIDPKILITLWTFATAEGVGSARALAQLCERDVYYRWICGGVSVNHHTLSDFRTQHQVEVDGLLTQTVAALMKHGVVTLKRVTQDGTKVRAAAGAASFRREETMKECLAIAKQQLETLRKELEDDSGAASRRERAARERAATERVAAIEAALAELPQLKDERAESDRLNKERAKTKGEIRVSTTDKDARVMKMADGGFRPAFNVQFAVDVDSDCIVGLDVSNAGTDGRQLEPVAADILNRTGTLPRQYLVDGGYVGVDNIRRLAQAGVETFAPVPKARKPGVDPHSPRRDDDAWIREWRQRMSDDVAKEIYKQRAAVAERLNAEMKQHRGLKQFAVRGLAKVTAVVTLSAFAYNLLQLLKAT
jgi:transposase